MSELSAQQAMEQAVARTRAQLNDGALVQGTLEYLWRLAFAAGARVGQQAAAKAMAQLPDSLRDPVVARAGGWQYGSPWRVLEMKVGSQFMYGGVDEMKPNCERLAYQSPGGVRMELMDTGERVRIPAFCWIRLISEEQEVEDG